jgi:hypothetical protein
MGRPTFAAPKGPVPPGRALRNAILAASFGAGAAIAATALAGETKPPELKAANQAKTATAPSAGANTGRSAAMQAAARGSASASPGGSATPAASGSAAPGDKQKQAAKAWAAVNGIDLKSGKLDDRLEALRQKIDTRRKTFAERRDAEMDRIRIRWGSLVDRPSVQEELRLHAMRVARLTRIQELSEVEGKTAVEGRALKAIDRENARHDKRMQELAMTPATIPGGAR